MELKASLQHPCKIVIYVLRYSKNNDPYASLHGDVYG